MSSWVLVGGRGGGLSTGESLSVSAAGKLIYRTHTRPDISFTFNLLSQFMHAPHEIHRQATSRVLAYLKGFPGKGLLFPQSSDRTVKVFTDVDFAGSIVDRRSTPGYCTFIFGSLVSWKSSKQDKVSHSSAEAEYRALADGAFDGKWIYKILRDLRVEYSTPIHFFCDNKSAIAVAKNPGQQGRIKHMELHRMFFKERMDEGMFDLTKGRRYVAFADQAVDVLTKDLSNPLRQYAVSKLSMDDTHTLLAGGC